MNPQMPSWLFGSSVKNVRLSAQQSTCTACKAAKSGHATAGCRWGSMQSAHCCSSQPPTCWRAPQHALLSKHTLTKAMVDRVSLAVHPHCKSSSCSMSHPAVGVVTCERRSARRCPWPRDWNCHGLSPGLPPAAPRGLTLRFESNPWNLVIEPLILRGWGKRWRSAARCRNWPACHADPLAGRFGAQIPELGF